jgi:hypothetical protein
MEKVKLFTQGISGDKEKGEFQKQVNCWLAKNPCIQIISKHIALTAGINHVGLSFVNCTIAIFYASD